MSLGGIEGEYVAGEDAVKNVFSFEEPVFLASLARSFLFLFLSACVANETLELYLARLL